MVAVGWSRHLLFCRVCAHLLPGAVSNWPHESWDRCQYLQVLYHVWPPRGLWAFCRQHEPRCCHVVQQAPADIRQCAGGSSTHRGNGKHCGCHGRAGTELPVILLSAGRLSPTCLSCSHPVPAPGSQSHSCRHFNEDSVVESYKRPCRLGLKPLRAWIFSGHPNTDIIVESRYLYILSIVLFEKPNICTEGCMSWT